ncbi:MAG TPA: FAD:protein FMN transferase [Streptosporangiaceae bacterium]|nr:FAD:protein FMN transferase [Streptosporangiaceae bacterium]
MTAAGAPASSTFGVFGTTAVLIVTDPAALGAARAIADAELAAVDKACSRFRPDSELSVINTSHGELAHVSELFAALIAEALRAAELTDGDVDPTCGAALAAAGYDRDFAEVRSGTAAGTAAGAAAGNRAAGQVPGWRSVRFDQAARTVRLERGTRLDLGATAKAWAADRCAGLIAARADCGALVSLGGDVAVAGPPPGDGWQVRATDDHAAGRDAPGQTVTIREGGLATSSITVRAWTAGGRAMHHIIDPATGQPARSCWRTVSVAAASCADANIASTAAIIRSEAAPAWLTGSGLPARLVRHDGTVVTTIGWPEDPAESNAADNAR